jgi:hypothetical protein
VFQNLPLLAAMFKAEDVPFGSQLAPVDVERDYLAEPFGGLR